LIWEISFLHLEIIPEELFSLLRKSERIKNFLYSRLSPRSITTLCRYLFFCSLWLLFRSLRRFVWSIRSSPVFGNLLI